MVAQNIALPNIRKFFVPDPDHILFEADLSGADAQVVAWEAEDEELKTAFKSGMKIHIKNARDVYPEKVGNMTDAELKATDHPGGIYHDCKRIVHGTNYGGSAKTIAGILKWPVRDVMDFQERWFALHPGIAQWHERTEEQLAGYNGHPQRTIFNRFGFRIVYFDRVEALLTQALAWLPQSTVAITCIKGALQVQNAHPYVQLLLQVHDSIIGQVHKDYEDRLPMIHKDLHVTIPYDDPLTIPWGFKTTTESWGAIS